MAPARRVRSLASIIVVGRPGSDEPREVDLEAAGLEGDAGQHLPRGRARISASEIRSAVGSGEPITGKVPPAVEQYIAAHGLYAG
jgi:nicotinic acid mononucleotide adenylyltransferase